MEEVSDLGGLGLMSLIQKTEMEGLGREGATLEAALLVRRRPARRKILPRCTRTRITRPRTLLTLETGHGRWGCLSVCWRLKGATLRRLRRFLSRMGSSHCGRRC